MNPGRLILKAAIKAGGGFLAAASWGLPSGSVDLSVLHQACAVGGAKWHNPPEEDGHIP